MTIISTPGKPDEVSTVENYIGEAAILPQMREQSVDQLHQAEVVCVEQDGAGEGKAIEPPLATKIEYDVQCEIANESDAAGGLHMYHQNHVLVEEINAVEENSSTGDQTATSSGESSKFCSTWMRFFKCLSFRRSLLSSLVDRPLPGFKSTNPLGAFFRLLII